ncbi:Protein translocase subunit SecA, partial [Bienertia sinuspersici]
MISPFTAIVIFLPKSKGDKKKSLLGDTKSSTEDETKAKVGAKALYGDPNTKKLKRATQFQSVSGKRQRKLLKTWRRDQKNAVEKGLVTLDDVKMAAAD